MTKPNAQQLTDLASISALIHAKNSDGTAKNSPIDVAIKGFNLLTADGEPSLPINIVLSNNFLKAADAVKADLKPDLSNTADPKLVAKVENYSFKADGKVTNTVDMFATMLPRSGKEPTQEEKNEVVRFWQSRSKNNVAVTYDEITSKLFGSTENYRGVLQQLGAHKDDGRLCPELCGVKTELQKLEAQSPTTLRSQLDSAARKLEK